MDYTIVFMAVEVEADSVDEAVQQAAEQIFEDPKFFVKDVDMVEKESE